MKLKKVPLEQIKPYPNNPRINDQAVDAVAESIRQCTYISPIVVDENMVILAGHTRYKAMRKLGMTEAEVIIKEGLTEEQKKKYRILDNKTNELATWDEELLNVELEGLDFGDFDFGFDLPQTNLDDIDDDEFNMDESSSQEPPKTKRGQIFKLGDHVLMCGDSTKPEDVDILMKKVGGVADLLVTDPPYNVDYEGKTKDALKIENDKMQNDEFMDFLKSAFSNAQRNMKEGAGFYVFYASRTHIEFETALIDSGLSVKEQLIWAKNTFTLGRQDYQWKHEPCLYGWKEGASHYFVNNHSFSTLFDDGKDIEKMTNQELIETIKEMRDDMDAGTIVHAKRPNANDIHPTMKPVNLIGRFVSNSSRKGDIVLDIFGGSGSTLIACEKLGRRCATMEFDPYYCDAIIQRYEELTGVKAVEINV